MPTRVDFASNATHRINQAAQTCFKQVSLGGWVLLYCQNIKRLEAFENAFWLTQDPSSFMPVVSLAEYVTLGHGDNPTTAEDSRLTANAPPPHFKVFAVHDDALPHVRALPPGPRWLLNLEDTCPPPTEGIDRILEIVSVDPEDAQHARARYTHYKSLGYQVKSFALPSSHPTNRYSD